MGNLANLTRLDLYQNRLNGEIPAELGNLGKLKGLQINDNRLSGCIPSNLRNQLDMEFSSLGGLAFC